MTRKQSSRELSSIAAKYVRMKNWDLWERAQGLMHGGGETKAAEAFFRDVRKLAASVLSQDETKGSASQPSPQQERWK
jgi:hypothetical protein